MADIKWTDAQWKLVNDAITEAFGKASVAGAFLPCYGPLPPSIETVRDEQLTAEDYGARVTVEDDTTLQLFNLTVKVHLSSEQVADESLSTALLAFRRAANTLAQVEDDIVFNGFARQDANAEVAAQRQGKAQRAAPSGDRTHKIAVSGPESLVGLSPNAGERAPRALRNAQGAADAEKVLQHQGREIVTKVANAIGSLEAASHPGPFACVLGSDAFVAVHTPSDGLVLPADRITPLLNGPLLRSGEMQGNHGVVVSLAGDDIDIVVATPPKAQFLQVTEDAKYLFRVYERFVLRIKDKEHPGVETFSI
jgi:uncharacterized linocin/CFP29 family protein